MLISLIGPLVITVSDFSRQIALDTTSMRNAARRSSNFFMGYPLLVPVFDVFAIP
jgi:hypothetical protein